MKPALLSLLGLAMTAIPASAQLIEATDVEVTGDRWSYPFNFTPGTRAVAASFGAIDLPGFDDRDGQLIVSFDTTAIVPSGLDLDQYHPGAIRLKVVISDGGLFDYDPTADTLESYYPESDPEHVDDDDTGRPIELFPVGYRNGESVETWTETSAFGGVPDVEPTQGARNIFAANIDADGNATDISNHLKERFEPVSLGVGQTTSVAPGQSVPADTEFTFDLALCDAGTLRFIREAFAVGTLNLAITSLHSASQPGGGGGGGPNYPIFYTKENPLAGPPFNRMAKIDLEVRVGAAADFNGDALVNTSDFIAYLNAFTASDPTADFNRDCRINTSDFIAFLNAFTAG